MSAFLRYDMLYAMIDPSFPDLHPQEQLKSDGMTEIHSACISVADCWIFEVEQVADPLPPWYKQIELSIDMQGWLKEAHAKK